MRILVVEDDPVSQKVIHKYLSTIGDCTVVENGISALQSFKTALDEKTPFDLICLDIMMPEMSGQHVLLALREHEKQLGIDPARGVKVIMTTGLDDPENVVGAFQNGCEAYVTKPISKDNLFKEIKKLGLFPS